MVTVMDDTATTILLRAIKRAPQWVRHDLASKDDALRSRAEETLVAILANALAEGAANTPQS